MFCFFKRKLVLLCSPTEVQGRLHEYKHEYNYEYVCEYRYKHEYVYKHTHVRPFDFEIPWMVSFASLISPQKNKRFISLIFAKINTMRNLILFV